MQIWGNTPATRAAGEVRTLRKKAAGERFGENKKGRDAARTKTKVLPPRSKRNRKTESSKRKGLASFGKLRKSGKTKNGKEHCRT